jgi:hypothetical protein
MKGCLILVISILPLVALAQLKRTEVPWKVRIQFMEDYVSATNATWQRDADNNYNVSFFNKIKNKAAT